MHSSRNLSNLRRRAGVVLLALWSGWMVAAFAAIAPRPDTAAALPPGALHELRAKLPAAALGRPVALRLPSACSCPGDEAGWDLLAQAVAARHGSAHTLDAAAPELAGHEVLILGADGDLRYAGALRPDPALCGAGSADARLARWLPALLASGRSVQLPAAASCAC